MFAHVKIWHHLDFNTGGLGSSIMYWWNENNVAILVRAATTAGWCRLGRIGQLLYYGGCVLIIVVVKPNDMNRMLLLVEAVEAIAAASWWGRKRRRRRHHGRFAEAFSTWNGKILYVVRIFSVFYSVLNLNIDKVFGFWLLYTKCGKFIIFQSVRFYVKLILGILDVKIGHFHKFRDPKFWFFFFMIFCNFGKLIFPKSTKYRAPKIEKTSCFITFRFSKINVT